MTSLVERDPTKNHVIAIAVASGGYLLGYYVSIMNSMAGPLLDGKFKVTGAERIQALGNLGSSFPIGACIGVLVMSRVLDTIGRRKTNLLLDLASIFSISLSLVGSLFFIQLSRFLIGFFASSYTMVVAITLVEMLPARLASLGNMYMYIAVAGLMLVPFIQQFIFSYQTLVEYWRIFMVYPMIISVIRFVVLFKYLNFDSTKFISSKFAEDPKYEDILRANLREVYADESLQTKVEEAMTEQKKSGNSVVSAWEVCTNEKYRWPMISALTVMIGQQLAGVSFLVFFSTEFFESVSGNGKTASFCVGVGNLLGGLVSSLIVDRFKRLTLLKVPVLGQGLCFFLILFLALAEIYAPLPMLVLLYMTCHGIGMGAISGLYVSESVPASGVGIGMFCQWFSAALVGKWSPIGVAYVGGFTMMAGFGVLCFVVAIALHTYCLDTEAENEAKKAVKGKLDILAQPLVELEEIKN